MKAKLAAAGILGLILAAGMAGTRDEPSREPSPERVAVCRAYLEYALGLAKGDEPVTFSEASETGKYPTFRVRGVATWGPSGSLRSDYSCTLTRDETKGTWRIEKATF